MIQQEKFASKSNHTLPAIVRKTVASIARGYAPSKIWIFGSFARGDTHMGSDLDLVIIKDSSKRFPDRIEEVLQFCPGGIAVEPLVYTQKEIDSLLAEDNSFITRVFSEGILVYKQ